MRSDEEDNIVGTLLEPIDPENIPSKKPKYIEDQVVKDEHGRRRFHGAFTGGFSAGYFNSVGSKEGWIPSNFISSRKSKASFKEQKVEEFMDKEDFGEFGFAPHVMKTTSDFDDKRSSSNRKRCMETHNSGPIPGEPVLHQLLRPTKETVGIKILRKMGWRPGEGIGPKVCVSNKQTTINPSVEDLSLIGRKVYGCAFKPIDEDDDDSNNWISPDDVPSFVINPKGDTFGLGYKGLDRNLILNQKTSVSLPLRLIDNKKKVGFSGQAFGVGAYEHEDESIYQHDDISQYDFVLGDENPIETPVPKVHQYQSWKILKEFYKSCKPAIIRKVFPLPSLPKDFKPFHKDSDITTSVSNSAKSPSMPLVAPLRNVLIGEAIENVIAQQEKNKRYQIFLQLNSKNQKDQFSSYQPETMTEWEKANEQIEFEQKSKVCQSLVDAMSNKFISAGAQETQSMLNNALLKSDEENAADKKLYGKLTRKHCCWHPDRLLCKRFNIAPPYPDSKIVGVPKDEKISGGNNITFVSSTSHDEMQASLPEPTLITSGKKEILVDKTLDKCNQAFKTEDEIEKDQLTRAPIDLFKAIFLDSESEEENSTLETLLSAEKTKNKNIISVENCHPKEQFVSKITQSKNRPLTNEKLLNAQTTAPVKSVFANIDFDALNSWRKGQKTDSQNISKPIGLLAQKSDLKQTNLSEYDTTCDLKLDQSETQEFYGPALPQKIKANYAQVCSVNEENRLNYKHNKHKHKQKKSKKKKKKHSEESSDDEKKIDVKLLNLLNNIK